MGDLPMRVFKTELRKETQRALKIEKEEREAKKLIGWVIKSKEKIEKNNSNIKPNE